jgi:hypothetical protein
MPASRTATKDSTPAQAPAGERFMADLEAKYGITRQQAIAFVTAAQAPKGSPYEALTNLSIGRISDSEKLADIVHKGEIVHLTDEQAQRFLTRHKVPVIRPAKQQNDPAPRIRARDLFGRQPLAQQFEARPDPAGSSAVKTDPDASASAEVKTVEFADPAGPESAPEANDPQTDLSVDPDAARDR